MNHEEVKEVLDLSKCPGVLSAEEMQKLVERLEAEYTPELSEDEKRIWDDIRWAENNPEFQERYAGKWLAIYNREVLAVGDYVGDVHDEAERKSGLPRLEIAMALIDDVSDWIN